MLKERFVCEERLLYFQKRWLDWKHSGWKNGDIEIMELCDLLNKIPGIVTRYCCASHPFKKPKAKSQFYINFVVTEDGLNVLMLLHHELLKRIYITFNRFDSFHVTKLKIHPLRDKNTWIPTITLETFLTRKNKTIFIGILLLVVEEFLRKNTTNLKG